MHVNVTFSPAGGLREFTVGQFHNERCEVNVKVRCLHKEKEGWRDYWTASSADAAVNPVLAIPSCYEWGSDAPAQVILTGWYKPADANSKTPWMQAAVKQLSSTPEIYEFTDPTGATARLEIRR